jgi:hypothetical protein
MFPELTEDQIEYVAESLKAAVLAGARTPG